MISIALTIVVNLITIAVVTGFQNEIRKKIVGEYEKNNFLKNLYKIGYSKVLYKNRNKNIKLLTSAFQRRFRQDLVNGIIDEECLLISKNLTKSIK